MSKAVLMSIQPKWVEKIASGEKTIEVRKTKPKLEMPFKVYIYCTYGEGLIEFNDECTPNHLIGITVSKDKIWGNCCNGKVVGEFICDKIEEFTKAFFDEQEPRDTEEIEFYLDQFSMSYSELCAYVGSKKFYGWHITDLKIYDNPKELSEFKRWNRTEDNAPCAHTKWLYPDCKECKACKVTRPPQSWFYVEVTE